MYGQHYKDVYYSLIHVLNIVTLIVIILILFYVFLLITRRI